MGLDPNRVQYDKNAYVGSLPAANAVSGVPEVQAGEAMRISTLQMIQSKVATPEERSKEMRRFAKFATVGAMGFMTQFIIVNLLVQLGGINESIANAIGFIAAVMQNFIFNRRWTFPESQARDAGRQLMQFFLVSVVGLVLNTAVFTVVHRLLEPSWMSIIDNPRLAHAVSYNFALCVAVGVVFFWNFTANRLWTYRGLSRKVGEEPPGEA